MIQAWHRLFVPRGAAATDFVGDVDFVRLADARMPSRGSPQMRKWQVSLINDPELQAELEALAAAGEPSPVINDPYAIDEEIERLDLLRSDRIVEDQGGRRVCIRKLRSRRRLNLTALPDRLAVLDLNRDKEAKQEKDAPLTTAANPALRRPFGVTASILFDRQRRQL